MSMSTAVPIFPVSTARARSGAIQRGQAAKDRQTARPWHSDRSFNAITSFSGTYRLKRVVKTPKLQFIDSGLLATLRDLDNAEIQRDRSRLGSILKTFTYGELLKHATTADRDYHLLYYCDVDQFEVDVVIENAAGHLLGVEMKAAATVRDSDLRGLKKLASVAGDQFKMGILLYDGKETMPLGDGLWAAPLSSLWGR